ncbi:MAG: hypothetical protein EA402_05580 [Planctomycetota bacterium]|nr:MAG: hypothetical protein EA402_05580 [Planctomycetota bacterium]
MPQGILILLCLLSVSACAQEPAAAPQPLPAAQVQELVTLINDGRAAELGALLHHSEDQAQSFIRLVASSFGRLESDAVTAEDISGTWVISHALGETHRAGVQFTYYVITTEHLANARLQVQQAAADGSLTKIRVLGKPSDP